MKLLRKLVKELSQAHQADEAPEAPEADESRRVVNDTRRVMDEAHRSW
ncbi:hypothetical protein [Bacillus toyonensis]|nr:hypothetical protein [Bacillus toyonensis]